MDAVIKTLLDAAMELEAALDRPDVNDMVYAWNNGLGVKFPPGRDPIATSALNASRALPGVIVLNGKNEKAIYMLRSRAIRIALESVRKAIVAFEADAK